MADKFDFSVDQLADNEVTVSYEPDNVPFSLTGHTGTLQMRRTPEASTAALTLTATPSASGSVVFSGSLVTLRFLKEGITAGLTGVYYYDLVATGPSTIRVVEGRISINPATTR